MKRTALTALLSHWRRHKLQAVTLVVGLALATGLWTGVQAINAQARLSYDEAAATLTRDDLPRLTGPITLADFSRARVDGWSVTPFIEANIPGTDLRLLGIDPFSSPPGGGVPNLSGAGDLTAFLSGDLVYAAPDLAATAPGLLPSIQPLDDLAPGRVVSDVAAALAILERDNLDALLVLPGREGVTPLTELIPGTRLQPPRAEDDLGRLTDSFHLNLTAFGLLSFAVGLFIVQAAIGLAFEQRRPLFRTMRALGVPGRTLITLVAAELAIITLIAGTVGVLLGYGVAAALLPGVAATLGGLYGASVAGGLTLSPIWWLWGFVMAGLGALLAGGQSLWALSKMPVLAAAMPRAWLRARRVSLRRLGFAGLGLLGASAILLWTGSGLLIGFAGLGALLIGAALLLPPIFAWLLDRGTALSRSPLGQWLWADTRQQLPGLSLALMALLLALATNIGVGTMVGSFRATFVGWLDQRLAAELYLTARDASQAAALRAYLEPRTEAVLPILATEAQVAGLPGDIFAQPDHDTFRDNWPLIAALPDAWDRLASGDGALLNEQTARREDIWPGQRVNLGEVGEVEVLGVYSDYGNPRGQAILTLSLFTSLFPEIPERRYAIRVDPSQLEALRDDIATRFDLPPDGIVDQAGIKSFSLQVFERTFAVTAALNILTLGVAAFALWASLTTLGTMRLPQVAPVWAMGLTRGRLAAMELLRAALLAGLTALLAVPLGVALAWTLLAVINVQAFGWRLPLLAQPVDWLILSAFALVAAILAALTPALRLWRMPPARLVQVFSHER
ncbi:MAG: FtsX-like permease family protein [Pseudomonadota bacterium]